VTYEEVRQLEAGRPGIRAAPASKDEGIRSSSVLPASFAAGPASSYQSFGLVSFKKFYKNFRFLVT